MNHGAYGSCGFDDGVLTITDFRQERRAARGRGSDWQSLNGIDSVFWASRTMGVCARAWQDGDGRWGSTK